MKLAPELTNMFVSNDMSCDFGSLDTSSFLNSLFEVSYDITCLIGRDSLAPELTNMFVSNEM